MNKSAIHIAAQLRDSEQLIDMLVKLGADVNAPTLRGHTPLLYAAGRRHSNAILALLARGASPLTITVTGDSALDMCVKNIGGIERNGCDTKKCTNEAIAAVLAAVVTRRNAEPAEKWRDFRADEDALQAQAEHAKSCKNCLNLLRRKGLLPPLRKPSDIVARLHDTLSRAKSAHDARADDDTVQDELSDLLVAEAAHACDRRACEPASERALRIAALDHAVAWLVGIPLVASADDGGGEEGGFRSSDVRAMLGCRCSGSRVPLSHSARRGWDVPCKDCETTRMVLSRFDREAFARTRNDATPCDSVSTRCWEPCVEMRAR